MGAVSKTPAQNRTPVKSIAQKRFLATYRNCANIRASCDAVGIARNTFYKWRDEEPEFAAQLDDLGEDATESLEQIGWERAKDSSDTLLIFFLKARRPEIYRDRHLVEVLKRYEEMSDDDLNELLARRLGEIAPSGEDRASGAIGPGEPSD